MDLIQMYHDQESQSSSSCEELTFVDRIENIGDDNNAPHTKISQRNFSQQLPPQPPLSPLQQQQQQHNGTNGRQPHRPVDKLNRNQQTNFAQWMTDIDKRVHLCLGSLNVLHKNTILESMDYFISKLTKDYNKLIKPKIAELLSNYIRTYLYVYRYLYRSYEMGKRYFKRIIKILAIYTDMELCASIRGTEYDVTIAERIQFIYQTHLLVNDQNMVLDVLLNMKRLWRRHRGILNLLLQHFLFLTEPVELVDLLFIKNLIIFKRWLYIEEVTEDRDKIRESFVKFVKPKKTICMNSLFKPYLPVDEEGFVRIENISSVLDSEISVGLLTRVLRKAEESNESQAKEILIVLTDDEDEVPTHECTQLNNDSHHSHIDDLSNGFECLSSISSDSMYTSNDIDMMIDTFSIDTFPSQESALSQPSIDLITDNTTSMSECVNTVDDSSDNNSESATTLCVPSDIMSLNSSNEYANTNDVPTTMDGATVVAANDTITMMCHELNIHGNNANKIPPLDQSTFNNLVNNINETQISDSFANVASNSICVNESMSISAVENEAIVNKTPTPTVTRHEMSCQTTISLPIHDISKCISEISRTSTEVAALLEGNGEVIASAIPVNGVIAPDRAITDAMTKENCDTENTSISNASLGNHQDTLLHIDEMFSAELNSHKKPSERLPIANDSATVNDAMPQNDASTQISDPIAMKVVNAKTSVANNSLIETELLSQSEQELLFNEDKDAFLMDIFSFGNDLMKEGTSKTSIASPSISIDERPPFWIRNSINNPPKTYSKIRKEKQLSINTTPNLADASANATTPPRDDEDSFLMDIFCSNDIRTRLKCATPTATETVYNSSTPKMSAGKREPTMIRRATRMSRKVNEPPPVAIKSPTNVPSLKKTTKKSESMTTKGNTKRQSKSPKSTKKATPTRTKTMNKSRLDRLLTETPPTILTRQTYIKPLSHPMCGDLDNNYDDNYTAKLHHSGTFYSTSFGRRSNGKCSLNAPKNSSSTILERKTYIKTTTSNTTPSNTSTNVQSQPYDSCSHNTSGSSTTNNIHSRTVPMGKGSAHGLKNDKTRFGSVVSNDSVELEYLKNLFSDDFDSSKGIRNPLPGLKLPRSTDRLSATASAKKRHKLSSDYSESDDMDDSTDYNTRKSKRSRKRPKKLDL